MKHIRLGILIALAFMASQQTPMAQAGRAIAIRGGTVLTVTRGTQTVPLKGIYQPTALQRRTPAFTHSRPSGRVDLVRAGNTITATTRRVVAFTLLLSPDQFDLSQPITVVADGKTVFAGTVKPSLQTLLKWAAKDNDRTMLFAAELPIRLTDGR